MRLRRAPWRHHAAKNINVVYSKSKFLWEIADNYLKLGQLEEAWQVSNSMESNEQIKRLNILCQKYGELEQKEKVDERK
ncbi:MAG: hypothetical protein ACRCT1_08950 [Microcoleaceae cyanobacterium]